MSTSCPKYVGIDFSGNQQQWNPNARASNVWIAVVEDHGANHLLTSLQRVQQLPGHGRPFNRLAVWLSNGDFSAAAIDAPFSAPWWCFGNAVPDHAGLLAIVDALPLNAARDFPTGNAFVASATAGVQFQFTKPLRVAESYWHGRGVNTRSTVWAGVRPGAPFASACIKLLANADRPIWPWTEADGIDGIPLVEAFPSAQLRHWALPFMRYNGLQGQANREVIVAELLANRGLQVNDAHQTTIKGDADALDAVLCCYAACAVVRNHLGVALPPFDAWQLEGWIAVHD